MGGMKTGYDWRFFRTARLAQVKIENGEDIAHLAELDRKLWTVLSSPTTGVQFDTRMLALMDTDGDGRIRVPEVLAAIDWLKAKGVNLDDLFKENPDDPAALAKVVAEQADLAAAEPTDADKAALKAWEDQSKSDASILPLGDVTAAAEAALAAVYEHGAAGDRQGVNYGRRVRAVNRPAPRQRRRCRRA